MLLRAAAKPAPAWQVMVVFTPLVCLRSALNDFFIDCCESVDGKVEV